MKIPKLIGRILLIAVAYIVGLSVAGMLSPLLHLPQMKPIAGSSPQHTFLLMVMSLPILIFGMLPLASALKGTALHRWFAIAILLYVTMGLNTIMEAKIFTGLLDGNPFLASLFWILPASITALALTYRNGVADSAPTATGSFGIAAWSWRVILAWLSFPVIYFLFGMFVAPFVVPYYNAASALGLRIPGFDVIIRTQLLRSAFFLAASMPAILLWTKSRARLFLALGLAHAVTIGLFPLAQAFFFPITMRLAHSLEITGDSFAYAAVLTLLFTRKTRVTQPQLKAISAAAH